jgi:DNA-binding CsgD family transcriptional regulator
MPHRAEQQAPRLVGRAAELAFAERALDGLERGRPGAVAVSGEPGIGKTVLLGELADRAGRRGHLVHAGSAAELERDLPFSVFVDALDRHVEEIKLSHLDAVSDATVAELATVFPALSTVTVRAGASAQHERYRTHRAVRDLLEMAAATTPLVLVLDDLHWADPGSVELLAALLRRPPAAPVLLALGLRPHQAPDRLSAAIARAQRDGALTLLEPAPLNRAEAHRVLGPGVDVEAATELHRRSGGNPFYLEQLSRAPARPDADSDLPGAGVPRAVAAALAEELRALSPGARRLADGAAVAGDPFAAELAAAAGAVPDDELAAALDELLRRDLVRPTGVPRRFRFRHPLLRQAAYESVPGGNRLAAHERAAAALAAAGASAAARAVHVEQSARRGDAAAVGVLREAGDGTVQRVPASAARWYGAALRLLPATAPAADRVELLGARAGALAAAGHFAGSRAALVESLALVPAGDPRAIRLTAACAGAERLLGRPGDAHARLVAAYGAIGDPASPEAVTLRIELAVDGFQRLDWTAMRDHAAGAAETARALADPVLVAASLAALAVAQAFTGEVAAARASRDEAAAMVDALADPALARRLDAAVHLAGADFYLDRFDDCTRHAGRAMEVGAASGQVSLFPLVVAFLGSSLCLLGRTAESARVLDAAVEAARLSDNLQALVSGLTNRAGTALVAGDLAAALAAAEEAGQLAAPMAGSPVAAFAGVVLADALQQAGDPARAVQVMTATAGGPDLPLTPLVVRAPRLELLARCHLAVGERSAARRAADGARWCADATGLGLSAIAAGRAAAAVLLDAGRPAAAAESALAAAGTADQLGTPVEAALARILAGRALSGAGDRDRATDELRRAAAALEAAGAHRYRDEAERELRRLGHRIHRRSAPGAGAGLGSLTDRERQVARLVVARRTNPEIAAELFLSTKTVETHLRNIFHKLGLSSRVQLAHAVERGDRSE